MTLDEATQLSGEAQALAAQGNVAINSGDSAEAARLLILASEKQLLAAAIMLTHGQIDAGSQLASSAACWRGAALAMEEYAGRNGVTVGN